MMEDFWADMKKLQAEEDERRIGHVKILTFCRDRPTEVAKELNTYCLNGYRIVTSKIDYPIPGTCCMDALFVLQRIGRQT